jgi:hypothetical protein
LDSPSSWVVCGVMSYAISQWPMTLGISCAYRSPECRACLSSLKFWVYAQFVHELHNRDVTYRQMARVIRTVLWCAI